MYLHQYIEAGDQYCPYFAVNTRNFSKKYDLYQAAAVAI